MKKIFTILSLFLMSFFVFGQTHINESFSGAIPPSGWTVDAHAANWKTSATNNAGGSLPECKFDYNPSFTGTSRLISPVINLTGITNLKVMFKHSIDHYGGAYKVGAATRSDGGNWNTIWEIVNPTANVTESKLINITNANVGSATFQICWFFEGNSYNIDYWYLDDVLLYTPLAHDAMVKNILVDPEYAPGTNLIPTAVLSNFGLNTETFNATCTIKLDGTTLYTQNCSNVTLAPEGEQTVTFPGYVLAAADEIYEINVKTNLAGDMNASNDMMTKYFDTYTTLRNQVILEIGTGTWCQYCPGASMGAHDLLAQNCAVGVVKNHNGDSFTNTFSDARNAYYGISGYPTAVFDGVVYYVGGSNTVSMYPDYRPIYDARKDKNCAYDVEIFGTNAGATYNLQVRVTKKARTPANVTNLVLHLALTESNIAFNWQGQTQVNNAQRLMAPDQNGTPLDFSGGDVQIVNLGFNLNSAWVGSNCELVSFIQNLGDKEILQGDKVMLDDLVALPVELTSFTASASKQGVILNWETATELNNSGFEVERSYDGENFNMIGFIKGAGTTSDVQTYTFVDKIDYSGKLSAYYRLRQVDFDGSANYSDIVMVDFEMPISFALEQNYPNPFNPSTKIVYAVPENAFVSLKLYDMTGQEIKTLVSEVKDAGTYTLNLTTDGLASGTYYYRMISGDFVSIKKLVVLK